MKIDSKLNKLIGYGVMTLPLSIPIVLLILLEPMIALTVLSISTFIVLFVSTCFYISEKILKES